MKVVKKAVVNVLTVPLSLEEYMSHLINKYDNNIQQQVCNCCMLLLIFMIN